MKARTHLKSGLNSPSGSVSATTSSMTVSSYQAGQTAASNSSVSTYTGIKF